MPARFVIDTSGVIRYAEASADYTKRPEPDAMLAVLAAFRHRLVVPDGLGPCDRRLRSGGQKDEDARRTNAAHFVRTFRALASLISIYEGFS